MAEVAVLDADEVWFVEREVEVEVDEFVERSGREQARPTTSVAPASSLVLMPTSSSTSRASLLGKWR